MDRRTFLIGSAAATLLARTSFAATDERRSSKDEHRSSKAEHIPSEDGKTSVAVTFDDPNIKAQPLFTQEECADKIIAALKSHEITTALFVCGKRIDSDQGKRLVARWDDAGHMICNHTYSHGSYNYPAVTMEKMRDDILRAEPLISSSKHFTKLLRFPYLKEGDTTEKRDAMRVWMHSAGYRNGYVTIDASDWYIDDRLKARLAADAKADLKPYRDFYLEHLWARSTYYNDLSVQVVGHPIRHTLLLHHTLANALFLGDLLDMYKAKGWNPISASDAFADPIFRREPKSLPAGESLIRALAKETGKFDAVLRYPGEDDVYEKPRMDALGL